MRPILLAVVLTVGLAACGGTPEPVAKRGTGATTTQAPAPDTTRPLRSAQPRAAGAVPDFAVTTFDGERFRLSDHVGTPVVLNFFESW